MWGFWDQTHWRPSAAIATGDDCHANEAGVAYQNIYNEFFRTKLLLDGKAAAAGDSLEFSFRGHRGEYEVALVDEAGNDVMVFGQTLMIEEDGHQRMMIA